MQSLHFSTRGAGRSWPTTYAGATPALLGAAMLGGVLVACWVVPPLAWGIAFTTAAVLAWADRGRTHGLSPITAALLALLFGGWFGAATLAERTSARFADAVAGNRLLVIARIETLPAHGRGQWTADADLSVQRPAAMAGGPRRVRLTGALGPRVPAAGETWRLLVEITPPRARLNPGGFDLERQWTLERLAGFGRVIDSPLNARVSGARPGLLAIRARIRDSLAAHDCDREALALVTAISIGDTGAMTREQWRVFAATGTSHLVAISGLHVTLFAWMVSAFARPLWRAVKPLQRVRREVLALPCGVLAALGYSLLAGFSIPTQRTVLMLSVIAMVRLSGRVLRPLDVLGAAVIGVLLIDPLAPLDAGFWLSFGAVAALVLHDSGQPSRPAVHGASLPAAVQRVLREQLWVGAALAPLTLLLFGTLSLAGWLANPVAIPAFSLLLVPLSLLAATAAATTDHAAFADALLNVTATVHHGIWWALRALAAQPWALWSVELPATWFALAPLALLVAWLPLPTAMRASALLSALPIVAGAGAGPVSGEARLTILDAGEGGAVIVRTRHHALLYGSAAAWGDGRAAVEQHVLPALRAAGIARLDALIVPRASAAEVAASALLLRAMPARRVLAGGEWRDSPPATAPCQPQTAWRWDGVSFELYAPRLSSDPGRPARGSCVLRVATAGASALLIGTATRADLEALGEPRVDSVPRLRADVLVGALRAARSAAQRDFTRRVAPLWWVATRRVSTDAELEVLATSQGMDARSMLSPSRHGPLVLRLSPAGPVRWSHAIEAHASPVWRQPRLAPPPRLSRPPDTPRDGAMRAQAVLSAPVRYDSALNSGGDPSRCGRSCGLAVR